jgi:hypothetical protein
MNSVSRRQFAFNHWKRGLSFRSSEYSAAANILLVFIKRVILQSERLKSIKG